MVRYLCAECHQPCELDVRDDSVGYTEMGSHGQVDPSRPYAVSMCCDADFEKVEREW